MPSAHQSRRDVLLIAAGAFVAVGAGFATWPLISQMAPNRGSKRDTLDVDLERLAIGQTRQLPWMGLPILVLHRTQAQISQARETSLLSLPDPFARVKGADGKPKYRTVENAKPRFVLKKSIRVKKRPFMAPALARARGNPALTTVFAVGTTKALRKAGFPVLVVVV